MWTVQADYLRQLTDAVVWGAAPSGSSKSNGGGTVVSIGNLTVQGIDAKGQALSFVQWLKSMGVQVVGVPA
jgi:hypothetical protein